MDLKLELIPVPVSDVDAAARPPIPPDLSHQRR
jgi:hypothetical protein